MTTLASADLLALAPTESPDVATLHCMFASELCFKIGEIKVSRSSGSSGWKDL